MSVKDRILTSAYNLRKAVLPSVKEKYKEHKPDKRDYKPVPEKDNTALQSLYDALSSMFSNLSPGAFVVDEKGAIKKNKAMRGEADDLPADTRPAYFRPDANRPYEMTRESVLKRVDFLKEKVQEIEAKVIERGSMTCKDVYREISLCMLDFFEDAMNLENKDVNPDKTVSFDFLRNNLSFISLVTIRSKTIFDIVLEEDAEQTIHDLFKVFYGVIDYHATDTLKRELRTEKTQLSFDAKMNEAFMGYKKAVDDRDGIIITKKEYYGAVKAVLGSLLDSVRGADHEDPVVLDGALRCLFKNMIENMDGFFSAIAPGFCTDTLGVIELAERKNAIANAVNTKGLVGEGRSNIYICFSDFLLPISGHSEDKVAAHSEFVLELMVMLRNFICVSISNPNPFAGAKFKGISDKFFEYAQRAISAAKEEVRIAREKYLAQYNHVKLLRKQRGNNDDLINSRKILNKLVVLCNNAREGLFDIEELINNLRDEFERNKELGTIHKEMTENLRCIDRATERFTKLEENKIDPFAFHKPKTFKKTPDSYHPFFEHCKAKRLFNFLSSDKMHFESIDLARTTGNFSNIESLINRMTYFWSKPSAIGDDFLRNRTAFEHLLQELIVFVDKREESEEAGINMFEDETEIPEEQYLKAINRKGKVEYMYCVDEKNKEGRLVRSVGSKKNKEVKLVRSVGSNTE